MNKIKELIIKYEEIIKYIIFGVLTTLVNYVSYAMLTRIFDLEIFISNLIAWLLSVIFAFITNKLIVFKSKELDIKVIAKEITSFFAARIFSLLLDMVILYIAVDLMKMNDLIIKLISNIIVIIINYLFSKIFIFKSKK